MTSKALTTRQPMGMFRPTSMDEGVRFANILAESSFVPTAYKGKAADVLIAMQMGSELGLAPMQSIQNIAVINGRPAVWGDAMLGIVLAHPDCEDIKETVENGIATCSVKRRGKSLVTRTFSIEDAKGAGLYGKGVWRSYPNRMLQMRARGFALRDAFADALRGLITAEEARDIPKDRAAMPNIVPSEPVVQEVIIEAQHDPAVVAQMIDDANTEEELKACSEAAKAVPEADREMLRDRYRARLIALREKPTTGNEGEADVGVDGRPS